MRRGCMAQPSVCSYCVTTSWSNGTAPNCLELTEMAPNPRKARVPDQSAPVYSYRVSNPGLPDIGATRSEVTANWVRPNRVGANAPAVVPYPMLTDRPSPLSTPASSPADVAAPYRSRETASGPARRKDTSSSCPLPSTSAGCHDRAQVSPAPAGVVSDRSKRPSHWLTSQVTRGLSSDAPFCQARSAQPSPLTSAICTAIWAPATVGSSCSGCCSQPDPVNSSPTTLSSPALSGIAD